MICYKDMTFCPFFTSCADGSECPRALTTAVEEAAEKWMPGHAPICRYSEKPDCYKVKGATP